MTDLDPDQAESRAVGDPPALTVEQRYGSVWWTGLAVGGAIMAFAVWGIFQNSDGTNPPGLAKWVVGSALVHDALVAPLVTVAGLALGLVLPTRVRGPVRGAVALSLLVTIFAIPLLRTFGKHADNSSTLPLDYGRNLVVVLAFIWTAAAAVIAWRRWREVR